MLNALAHQRGVTMSDMVRHLIRRETEAAKHLSPLDRDAAFAQGVAMIQREVRVREALEDDEPGLPPAIVEAPGDLCGNSRRLPNGDPCPGCRACC